MLEKTNKIIVKTNLENATPEQRESFMKNLVEAHRTLYRSVVERHYKEVMQSLEKEIKI